MNENGAPKKRSRYKEEDADDNYGSSDDVESAVPQKKARMSVTTRTAPAPEAPSPPPPATPGEKPRQFLTETEKKQNHIRSEQKRRNAIKDGFSDLSTMIPDLQNNGPSRSSNLTKTVEWIEAFLDINKQIRLNLGVPDTDAGQPD